MTRPAQLTQPTGTDLERIRQQVNLYRQGFREIAPRESQMIAIQLLDMLDADRECEGLRRLVAAVDVAGDFADLIGQMQPVANAAVTYRRSKSFLAWLRLAEATDAYIEQLGDDL